LIPESNHTSATCDKKSGKSSSVNARSADRY
jgi:hypothetical protein